MVVIAIVAISVIVSGANDASNASIKNPKELPYDGRGLTLTVPTLGSENQKRPDDYWKANADGHEEFVQNFDRFFRGTTDFSFHTHLVGIKHANPDRTRRGPAIKRCVPLEPLILVPEPDNPEDPLALAVRRSSDRFQLGYLDWLTARDLRRDMASGRLWIGLFKRFWCADTGAVLGAEIVLVRLKADVQRTPQA
jgi:hypothetical protein